MGKTFFRMNHMSHIKHHLLCLLMAVCALSSCSESDDDEAEYPSNWAETNTAFFQNIYNTAKQNAANGDSSWKVFKSWTLSPEKEGKAADYIVVHVLEEGEGTVCPLYSDTVRVHYSGRLLPSKSYPTGYVFEKTWTGEYNTAVNAPAKLGVSMNPNYSTAGAITGYTQLIDGFTTALMHMHVGDRWEVYMPQELAYGSSTSNEKIPAYSTLIFDLTLAAIYHPGTAVPSWRAPKK